MQLTIAEIEGYVLAAETTNLRMLSAELHGEPMKVMQPMMMTKLFTTKAMEKIAEAAYDLTGGDGLLGTNNPEDGVWPPGTARRRRCRTICSRSGRRLPAGPRTSSATSLASARSDCRAI